jgi:hypothetical protein
MVIVEGQGRFISNFALTHFMAAKLFAAKTREIEVANLDQPLGQFWQEISIYCASTLTTAAASLEALINELFIAQGDLQSRVDNFDTFFWGGEETVRKFCIFKKNRQVRGLEMKPALEKYKKAVKLLERPPLSRSDAQFMAADALIGFRNYLIHFKPLWDESRRDDELEQRLNGLFDLSPFVDENASFLAQQCMSAGCSDWAVQTVVDFVDYFQDKSGLDLEKLNAFK